MFWWIALAAVVVDFALAWWSSGRARLGPDIGRGVTTGGNPGKAQADAHRSAGGGNRR